MAELIYTCVANVAGSCHKNGRDGLIAGMEHYCDPDDFNKRFYHATGDEVQELLRSILKDAARLRELCKEGFCETDDYWLLLGCMEELTVTEGDEIRVRTREDGGFHSGMLQNPSDQEATFRKKAGKEHRGYAANVEEAAGENGSVITDCRHEQNTYSDSQFLKDSIENAPGQEEERILVADGACGGIGQRVVLCTTKHLA